MKMLSQIVFNKEKSPAVEQPAKLRKRQSIPRKTKVVVKEENVNEEKPGTSSASQMADLNRVKRRLLTIARFSRKFQAKTVAEHYRLLHKEQVDFERFGFSSHSDLLETIPEMKKTNDGHFFVVTDHAFVGSFLRVLFRSRNDTASCICLHKVLLDNLFLTADLYDCKQFERILASIPGMRVFEMNGLHYVGADPKDKTNYEEHPELYDDVKDAIVEEQIKKIKEEVKEVDDFGQVTEDENSLEDHQVVPKKERKWLHACLVEDCSASYKAHTSLENHMVVHTGNETLFCNVCRNTFYSIAEALDHIREYRLKTPKECCSCGKFFPKSHNLMSHHRTHTGEKPHVCKVCGLCFSQDGNLKAHARTHTGDKPYVCEECGHRFTERSTLKKHMRTHTGEKPYTCDVCGQKCAHSRSLQIHKRKHTGEKPYVCKHCGYAFKDQSAMKRHTLVHTGEKPYVCEQCGRGFNQLGALKEHRRTHEGKREFVCEKCGASFIHRSGYYGHKRKHREE